MEKKSGMSWLKKNVGLVAGNWNSGCGGGDGGSVDFLEDNDNKNSRANCDGLVVVVAGEKRKYNGFCGIAGVDAFELEMFFAMYFLVVCGWSGLMKAWRLLYYVCIFCMLWRWKMKNEGINNIIIMC